MKNSETYTHRMVFQLHVENFKVDFSEPNGREDHP